MIYPRNKSMTSTTSKQLLKRDFLNPFQRAELKKRLNLRYAKKYGKDNKAVIGPLVENFFNQNTQLNAGNLKELEKSIQTAVTKQNKAQAACKQAEKSQAQGLQASDNLVKPDGQGQLFESQAVDNAYNPQVAPKESKNVNLPLINRTKTPRVNCNGGGKKLPRFNSQRKFSSTVDNLKRSISNNGLLGKLKLTERAKWNAINKYNFYVFKQNEKLEKIRKQQKMEKMRRTLDGQVKEKMRQREVERKELESYRQTQRRIAEIEQKKVDNVEKLRRDKVKFAREMRDLQMKETAERKRFEREQQETLDNYILQKIKKELADEEVEKIEAKKEKRKNMLKVLQENDARKRKVVEQQEKEKQEDVDLQRRAIEMGEELERQREEEFRTKANRINEMINSSKGAVLEQKNKGLAMEVRNRRYMELKAIAMKKKVERDRIVNEQRKKQLRDFLDQQVKLPLLISRLSRRRRKTSSSRIWRLSRPRSGKKSSRITKTTLMRNARRRKLMKRGTRKDFLSRLRIGEGQSKKSWTVN